MAQVGFKGAVGVQAMGGGGNADSSFSLSTPAGWAGLWWIISIVLISVVLFSL
jgi:hypothetical protein